MALSAVKKQTTDVIIKPANLQQVVAGIAGNAPYVQNRFANREGMMATQREGKSAKNKKVRAPKDFDALYEGAIHRFKDTGLPGIPASAFRASMIDACRLTGAVMTMAKLTIMIIAD